MSGISSGGLSPSVGKDQAGKRKEEAKGKGRDKAVADLEEESELDDDDIDRESSGGEEGPESVP